MKRSLICAMSVWVSGFESMSKVTMSFAVTMPGGRCRAIRYWFCGLRSSSTMMWPKASTTWKWNRILLASTRSSSWTFDGLEEAVFAETFAAVFTGVFTAFLVATSSVLVARVWEGKDRSLALRAQALDLQLGEEWHQRMGAHPHDRRQVELDQCLALVGGKLEAVRI